MKIVSVFFIVFIAISRSLLAQPEVEAQYLTKKTSLEIQIVDNKLDVREHHFEEKVFYKNYEKHSHESIFFSDFDPILELEAVSLVPDRGGYKKEKVSTIETKDIVQPGIFYGGYQRKDFVYPKLSPGTIGRLNYTKQITDVHLLSPFYFGDDIPVKAAEFSVSFPEQVAIQYKLFGQAKENVAFSEQRIAGNIKKYVWTFKDVPIYAREKKSPSLAYSAPHIIVYVKSYIANGNNVKILSDVSDLYNWYTGLLSLVPKQNDGDLKAMVVKLTSGLADDKEKVRVLFQWVQRNIKYVAFENGMAGFVPRASADVYEKRYGDCKDMANLLKDMLSHAGIPAFHTWIGTRTKPYSYEDVPTAIADNHMICAVRLDDEYLFLDATNPFVSFGMPSSMIQGKEALIGVTQSKFEVMKVPVVGRLENQRLDTIKLSLDKDGIRGNFVSTLRGYKKDDIESSRMRAEVQNENEYISDYFNIGSNNITVDKILSEGLGALQPQARVSFDFFQPGYYKSIGDKIYVNLNFNKNFPGDKIAPERNQPVEEEYRFEDKLVTIFTIPDGYEVSFLPPATSKSWNNFGLQSKYKTNGNQIILEKTFHSDYLYLPTASFNEWNEMLDAVSYVNQQSIILLKKK